MNFWSECGICSDFGIGAICRRAEHLVLTSDKQKYNLHLAPNEDRSSISLEEFVFKLPVVTPRNQFFSKYRFCSTIAVSPGKFGKGIPNARSSLPMIKFVFCHRGDVCLFHRRKKVLYHRLWFFRPVHNSRKFLDFDQKEGSYRGSNLGPFDQQLHAPLTVQSALEN